MNDSIKLSDGMIDSDDCNNLFELETYGDWDGVKAWAAMPKYKEDDAND